MDCKMGVPLEYAKVKDTAVEPLDSTLERGLTLHLAKLSEKTVNFERD